MEHPSTRYTTAQRMIRRLPDVSSCEIQVDEDGEISAVHVTARAGRSPKQIARDVEAVLAAEEGVVVDHRKISIAQFGEGELPASAPALGRINLAGVSLHHGGNGLEAEVTLGAGSAQSVGRALGANTRFEVRRVVAQATLDSVMKLADAGPSFSLGEVEERDLGTRQVILVCVNRAEGRSESI